MIKKRKRISRLLMEKLEDLYFQKNNARKKFSERTNRDLEECIYFYCVLTDRYLEHSPEFMDYRDGLMPDEDWREVPIEYVIDNFKTMNCFFICTNKKKKYVDNGVLRVTTFFEFLKHLGELKSFLRFNLSAPYPVCTYPKMTESNKEEYMENTKF